MATTLHRQTSHIEGTSRRSSRRSTPRTARLGIAVVAVVVMALAAGCGSGFQAETNQIYQPGPGISDRSSQVFALNTLIVTDGSGNGTLVSALLNEGIKADTLTAVALVGPKGEPLKATIQSSTIALPPNRRVQLADTGDVRFSGTIAAGANYTLTLTFARAAPITFQIPAVANTRQFSDVPVGPIPPPTTPSHSEPSK